MARSGPGSGYVGREAELERLARRLEQAAEGHGGMVLLRGPSGMGATRTAHEIAARANRLGMLTLWGQMVDGLAGRPFGGLADALEELGTSQPPQKLREHVGAGAPPLCRLCPRLRDVLPGVPPAAPLETVDERLRLRDAVAGWLKQAAVETALLLVLDDWQWADEDTRELLRYVVAASAETPLLILATESLAPEKAAAEPPGPAEVFEISGLDEGALAIVVGDLSDRPIAPDALAAIHEVSAGHPLFARELFRHLVEEKRLVAARTPAATELPATFEAVIVWRMSRMPPETRTLMGALACFPRGVTSALLGEVTGMARARLAEVVEQGVSAGLIRLTEHGQHYTLYHDRLRQALSSSTPARVRAAIHRRAGAALQAELGEDARAHAVDLVDHLVEAAQAEPASSADPRAVRHLLVAAEQARAAYAHQRAALLVGYALTAFGEGRQTDYVELAARHSLAQAEAGQTDAAARSLRDLLTGQKRHGVLTRETWVDVVTAIRTIRYSGAVAVAAGLARTALDDANPRDETLRRRLQLLAEKWVARDLAGVRSLVWQLDDSDAAAVLAEKGDETDRADVYLAQRPRTPADTGKLTISIAGWHRPAGTLRGLRAATTDLLLRLGQFRAGAGMAGRYLASAERFGSLRDVASALLLLSRARAALGELAAAAEILAAADSVIGRIPEPADITAERLLAELTLAHYADGDWTSLVQRIGDISAGEPSPWGLELAGERCLAEVRAARQPEAREGVEAVLAAVGDLVPLTLGRDAALFEASTATWELGAAEYVQSGRVLLDRAVNAGAGGSHTVSPRLAIARLHALIGNVDEARSHFAREKPRLEAAGLRPLRAILDHDEAIAIAAGGTGFAEANALMEQAFRQFQGLGMLGWARRAEALQASGFESAAQPGGRLFFSYPVGLSRREVDVVRLLCGGESVTQAAQSLDIDQPTFDRYLAAAMEKLGAANLDELPRFARRHGLGGT